MPTFRYKSTKTYEHSVGLSACFRQWRAKSHCRFLHGYALQVKLVFRAHQLDETNWVVDFGALKGIKATLQHTFDHKVIVARDDPQSNRLQELEMFGLAEICWVDNTGCEAFAKLVYEITEEWLREYDPKQRVVLDSVEIREHGGNSAIYERLD